MKTKALLMLLVSSLVALAAWLVYRNSAPDATNPDQAEAMPEKYRETVDKGLEYLVKNQFKDGHWEGDDGKHPVAMTGLVGLALLMEAEQPNGRIMMEEPVRQVKYAANIANAVDWLMDQSRAGRDGLIYSEHPSETSRYMQGHGMATLFLAGACKDESDVVRRKKLTDVLTRAVKYIVRAQSTQGGWYHTSKVEGHDFDTVSATVIQIQALQAAENAGIPVPSEIVRDAQEYLKTVVGKYEKRAALGQSRSRLADTAAALACIRSTPLWLMPSKNEMHDQWFKYCQSKVPVGRDIKFGRDEIIHYCYAQAAFNLDDDIWKGYRTAMFDHLQSSQNKDGSWPAGDGISVGPVYSTAVWCTVLQLEKRSHPSRSPEPVASA